MELWDVQTGAKLRAIEFKEQPAESAVVRIDGPTGMA